MTFAAASFVLLARSPLKDFVMDGRLAVMAASLGQITWANLGSAMVYYCTVLIFDDAFFDSYSSTVLHTVVYSWFVFEALYCNCIYFNGNSTVQCTVESCCEVPLDESLQ